MNLTDRETASRFVIWNEYVSLNQTAWLGYSDIRSLRAFNHAFKRWTGTSKAKPEIALFHPHLLAKRATSYWAEYRHSSIPVDSGSALGAIRHILAVVSRRRNQFFDRNY